MEGPGAWLPQVDRSSVGGRQHWRFGQQSKVAKGVLDGGLERSSHTGGCPTDKASSNSRGLHGNRMENFVRKLFGLCLCLV